MYVPAGSDATGDARPAPAGRAPRAPGEPGEPGEIDASRAPRESRIRVLPRELADQIAAGEVVERPASVVKELAENALDAGAGRIEIDVEGGGRRLIRVRDDGCGMSPVEARLALARHATSKLRDAADLLAIATMGFRGEALPSIAAVSRLTLTTREPDALAGFRIEVEAGIERDARAAGAPVGTQVEVRDLLWNLPARLKFLKAEPTEAAHVTEAVARLALAHPATGFRLRHGGRTALDVPPVASALERVRAVLAHKLAARVFETESTESGVAVHAFLWPPDEAQTTSRGVSLYCGRRYVRDRGLLHAVVMGYGELLPAGRYPTAAVFVDPPAGAVDVNVHPQKIEVRFARPQEVYAAVRHAVAAALARAPWLAEPVGARPAPVAMYAVTSHAPPPVAARLSDVAESYAGILSGWRPAPPSPPAGPPGALPASAAGQAPAVARGPTPARAQGDVGFFGDLLYLGQLDRTYLVCEAPGELILIDQHAAHERVAFERLRRAHRETGVRTQRLLFPRTVPLPEALAACAEENRGVLLAIGFELEPFGGAAMALKAAPVDLRDEEVLPTLRELLADLAERGASRAAEERVDLILATLACHSVVRAGDVLSPTEAQALLAAMDGTDFRGHCPHGRPVLLRIGVPEIARRFGRT
jgi:DNA mismatch repair protein MutL